MPRGGTVLILIPEPAPLVFTIVEILEREKGLECWERKEGLSVKSDLIKTKTLTVSERVSVRGLLGSPLDLIKDLFV